MSVVAILQARFSSSRLPGKVLADLHGRPMLERQIERLRRAATLDRLVLATSEGAGDDPIAALGQALGVPVFRGSLDDVLDRMAGAARAHGASTAVRLTADCPLADPVVIDAAVRLHLDGGFDITTNALQPTYPDGLDVEAMRASALAEAAREASLAYEREHVTQFLYRRPERYRIGHLKAAQDRSGLRWTVDEPDDLAFVRAVYGALYDANPGFGMDDVLALLERRPDIAAINDRFRRNEGLARSMAKEAPGAET